MDQGEYLRHIRSLWRSAVSLASVEAVPAHFDGELGRDSENADLVAVSRANNVRQGVTVPRDEALAAILLFPVVPLPMMSEEDILAGARAFNSPEVLR